MKSLRLLAVALAVLGVSALHLVQPVTHAQGKDVIDPYGEDEDAAPKGGKKDSPKKDNKKADENDYEETKKRDSASDEYKSAKTPNGLTEAEIQQVKAAIENGRKVLMDKQKPDGSWDLYSSDQFHAGGQALILLTLVKCGVPRDHQCIEKGKTWLRSAYDSTKERLPTYTAGAILMFLEAYNTKEEIQQGPDKKTAAKAVVRRLSPKQEDLEWIKALVKRLEDTQNAQTGIWGYPGNTEYGQAGLVEYTGAEVFADISNAQYALLGLKAASRMGVRVSNPDLYRKVCGFLIDKQEKDGPKVQRVTWDVSTDKKTKKKTGTFTKQDAFDNARGWTYTGHNNNVKTGEGALPRTGSMTAAAIAGLVIAKSELIELKKLEKNDQMDQWINNSVWDGIAWLDTCFRVDENPQASKACVGKDIFPGWKYYYLYGLERAGMLTETDFFGQHEWYPEGCRHLLTKRESDGTWPAGPGAGSDHEYALANTCFALLFLKRATTPTGIIIPKPITGRK